jgi:AmmeMemoRadiSam system protein B
MASTPLAPCPLALFAPHIDFHRGGPAYAWAYQALSECAPPDVIVALGVAHMTPNSPWVLTHKDYETPYGPMALSDEIYRDVQSALWYDGPADQWAHRTEHSLEFQALWLKYLWRDKTPPWVPILCSSFDRFCPDRAPSTIATIEDGINKIGEKLKARQAAGQTIMILAGVDLSHVGPRFGDEEKLGPELEKKVEEADRVSLAHALKGDADAMYLSVVEGGHWRKWCGLSAVYTSLRLARILSGKTPESRLLTYGQAPDPMGGLVSFTSVITPR